MSRLIDADALIADMEKRYCKNCERRKGVKGRKIRMLYEIGEAPCRACGTMDAMDEIDNAPTVGGWVSVNDKLPEQGKNVLVYIERNAYYRNGVVARKREIAIGWHIEGSWHVDECSGVVGICWQGLPELPKEVSE